MKATYEDTIQMDWLLLGAREVLAEANEVGAGRKARITIYPEDSAPASFVYPFRVAAYARWMLGAPVVVAEAGKVSFFSRGIAVVVVPSRVGYARFIGALLAHNMAEMRQMRRERAKIAAKVRRNQSALNASQGQKGGPQS